MDTFHGTTIVGVRRRTADGWHVALGGDGQVTLGNIVVKGTARKVRRLYHDKVLAGFAGATADAFTLFERFEAKLEKHQSAKRQEQACQYQQEDNQKGYKMFLHGFASSFPSAGLRFILIGISFHWGRRNPVSV